MKSGDLVLYLTLIIYISLAFLLLPHFLYQLNPDGISYIGIAQKYSSLNFKDAINGYWGPLISWMMVPIISLGVNPLLSANLILILIGAFVVIAADYLIKLMSVRTWMRLTVIILISVIVIFYVYRAITPDLLFVLFSLLLIIQIINGSLLLNTRSAILLGMTGAGLYLTKHFGFPFFISVFLIFSLIFYLRAENKAIKNKIIFNYATAMIVFLLLSGIWILLISHKYGQFIIGTTGIYNRSLSAPGSPGHPIYYYGLLDPPNRTAISIWEDVSYIKIQKWNIFDSLNTIILEVKVIIRNIFSIIKFTTEFSVLFIPTLLIVTVYLISKGRKFIFNDLSILVSIILILFSGYALISVDPRFLWLSNILVLIIGFKLLDLLSEKLRIRQVYILIIGGLMAGSFLIMPVRSIIGSLDNGKYLKEMHQRLEPLEISGNVASSDNWEISMYLSFLHSWSFYGQNGHFNEEFIEKELKEKNIDYYLVWEPFNNKLEFLSKYPEITKGAVSNLKIYKLHK